MLTSYSLLFTFRFRKQIGAENIQIYCDIKKKHRLSFSLSKSSYGFSLISLAYDKNSAHAITSDVSLAHTAKAAEFFLADGVILTGAATGDPAAPSDFKG